MEELFKKPVTPLSGSWRYGNGVLVCGTIRIATQDIDTNPSEEFKAELFDWICKTLNEAQKAARRTTQQPAQSEEARDAARYRRLRENWIDCEELGINGRLSVIDMFVDKAMQKDKP